MAKSPKDFEKGLEQLLPFLEKEQWEECIHACTKFLELAEKDASVHPAVKSAGHRIRGVAYSRLRAYESARDDFHTALKLTPNDANVYNNRGTFYYGRGDIDLAIADFEKALGLDPNLAEAYNNRGLAYEKKGDFDHASADFSTAVELDDNFAKAYNNRGLAYVEKEDFDHAIADFTRALQIQPDDFDFRKNRADAYSGNGDYDSAVADCDDLLKKDPGNKIAMRTRDFAIAEEASESTKERYERRLKWEREQINKESLQYRADFLEREEYKSRHKNLPKEAEKIDGKIRRRFFALQCYAALVFVLVAVAIAYTFLEKVDIWPIFPFITVAGLCAFPLIWNIRTLKQEKSRLLALSEDAYTKGILANLINMNLDDLPHRKELLHKFFDHHAEHGSAQLIIDLEKNGKPDNDPTNILVQQLKDNPPGK